MKRDITQYGAVGDGTTDCKQAFIVDLENWRKR